MYWVYHDSIMTSCRPFGPAGLLSREGSGRIGDQGQRLKNHLPFPLQTRARSCPQETLAHALSSVVARGGLPIMKVCMQRRSEYSSV